MLLWSAAFQLHLMVNTIILCLTFMTVTTIIPIYFGDDIFCIWFIVYWSFFVWSNLQVSTLGVFLPEASFGLRVLSLPVSVGLCVRVRVYQSQACPHDNSPLLPARIAKFGTKVQGTLVKVPIVFGDDRSWPSRSNLIWKSKSNLETEFSTKFICTLFVLYLVRPVACKY